MLEQCCKYSKQCRNNVVTLCSARCESYRVTSPLRLLPPRRGIQIQESGKLCVIRNPKRAVRNPTNDGIRNSSFTEKESGIQSLESGIQSVESKLQDCLGFPYMGARLHASDSTDSRRVSKLKLFALSCASRPVDQPFTCKTCLKWLTFQEEY